ncbi:SNF1-related protein kinase catalytic subunit alpha KIN10-like isoform X1 [Typha angustifolia]|uniref:SNF1-related protein kinase catalytic subunit alpha KIN10-like isoform X1 n=1 Tax=Typha angustifolia TaxID=59011 RepID=UPI003C2BCC85
MESLDCNESGKSQVLQAKYILGKKLGIGSFGKVKLAQHILTGKRVAIKILNLQSLNEVEVKRVRCEIEIMGRLSHPNIVRLYEVIETKSKIYLVMEYMSCGELYDYITERGRLTEDEARYIFQQIIAGVEFCHLNKVAHRDLKLENLLVDSECRVKLADFGLSNIMRDGYFLKTCCGSPNYAAPEVISGNLYIGSQVDVWSSGIILYVLLCGRLPFDADNFPNLFKQIKEGLYTIPHHVSPLARDLIIRILVVNPIERITIPQIREHPWFQFNLPQCLTVPAEVMENISKKVDEDVLQGVISHGFDHFHVIQSLKNRIQNEATVTYYLLLDEKIHAFGDYDYYSCQNGYDCNTSRSHQLGGPAKITWNNLHQWQRHLYMWDGAVSQKMQIPVKHKWAAGVQSSADPRGIITEVLRAFQILNVRWENIGDYNMKCRWLHNAGSSPQTKLSLDMNQTPSSSEDALSDVADADLKSGNNLEFEVQLYKAPQKLYLLDLQRVRGPPILFLEFCHSFLCQLHLL